MNRKICSLAILALCGIAAAQVGPSEGKLTTTFGYVTNPDGTQRSVKGLDFPVTLKRIDVRPSMLQRFHTELRGGKGREFRIQPTSAQAYLNDNGNDWYFVSGLDAPSVLDDLVLSAAGQNTPWNQLMCGINIGSTELVILRWVIFNNSLGDQGVGNSAFGDVLADFGGYFDPANTAGYSGPGTYQVTFNISAAGVVVPDGELYMGAQVREPQPDGEGDFILSWGWVFCGGGPSNGSSDDVFWYDHDPVPNGIYEGQEIDNFGGPPNDANLLLGIQTSGTASRLNPFAINMLRGELASGSFVDLWFSDDTKAMFDNIGPDQINVFPIDVEIVTVSPSANLLSMTFTVETSSEYDPSVQKVWLFNYDSNQWDEVDERDIAQSDISLSVTIPSNPTDYVHPSSKEMKARVQLRRAIERITRGAPTAPRRWSAWIDHAVWDVVTP